MRFVRPLLIGTASLGVVACTALLGDFTVGGGGNQPGGPETGTDGTDGSVLDAGELTVTPAQPKMGIFRLLELKATIDVTWSVQEGDAAGTIDDKGVFLSGATPGTYHIVAKSKVDPSKTVTIPVVVTNLAVNVLVGANGGAGNIDGPSQVAHFNEPNGVVGYSDQATGTRRMYIADSGNHTIRAWDDKTGMVTTIAGKAGVPGAVDGVGDVARFKSPARLALDVTNKRLYIADSSDGSNNGTCIRSLNLSDNKVTTIAGVCGTPGSTDVPVRFQAISSMVLAGDGSSALYLSDSGHARRVDLAAGATYGTTKSMLPVGTTCQLLTVDTWNGGSGQKVVYFWNGSQVKRFNEATVYPISTGITDVTSAVGTVPQVDSMVFANYYDLFLSNQYDSVLYRLANASSATNATFPSTPVIGVQSDRRVIDGVIADARLGRPSSLGVSEQYDLLFTDTQANAVRRARNTNFQNGTVDTPVGAAHVVDLIDGPRQTARLTGPFSVAADEAGVVYFADINFGDSSLPNNTIRKYDRTAALVSTISGIPTKPLDPAQPPTDGPKGQARFWLPIDMTYTKGMLYVVDNFAQAIRTVDVTTGTVATLAGEKKVAGKNDGVGAAAHFNFANYASASGGAGILAGAITTDGNNVYVSDTNNYAIRQVVIATGEVTTIAGGVQGNLNGVGKSAQFKYPLGITYHEGFLYIADYADHTIRRLNLATKEVDGFIGLSGQAGDKDGDAATATINSPFRITADGLGNLYISELPLTNEGQPNGIIRRINIKNRTVSAFGGTPGKIGLQSGQLPSTLNCPTSMAAMPGHDLVFGDFCDASIGIFQPL